MLCSCDPAIGYQYSLHNNSEKELKLHYKSRNKDSKLIIIPNSEVIFYNTNIPGRNPHDENDQFLHLIDSLYILSTDSSKLTLEYLKRENWTYSNSISHVGFVKTGVNKYKLELQSKDFTK